jgi:hypothetical protein
MTHISVWNIHNGKSYTYIDLGYTHALTLVDMVTVGSGYLIADASEDVAPKIHPRIRTSWFTRNLPEDESEPQYPCSPGCPAIKHSHQKGS